MITERHPSFLGTLAEAMADELAFASDSNPSNPFSEAVYTWLDHVLHSAQWELHRRFLSLSYIQAVCEGSSHSNHWTALLEKKIEKQGRDKAADSPVAEDENPFATLLPGQSADAAPAPDIDERELKALSRFGWDLADTYDSRPVSVA